MYSSLCSSYLILISHTHEILFPCVCTYIIYGFRGPKEHNRVDFEDGAVERQCTVWWPDGNHCGYYEPESCLEKVCISYSESQQDR